MLWSSLKNMMWMGAPLLRSGGPPCELGPKASGAARPKAYGPGQAALRSSALYSPPWR
jgi:hypothetical protein